MPRGRPSYPDLLTPREREVLSLIREGLTNHQIAERLGISESGARYHVSEILGKLGVQSRAEAAAWQPEVDRRRAWALGFFTQPLEGIRNLYSPHAAGGVAIAVTGGLLVALAIGFFVMTGRAANNPARAEVYPTSTPPVPEATPQPNPYLLAENRDRLRICLQPVSLPRLDMALTMERLEAAMLEVEKHPRWNERRYSEGGEFRIGVGCPREPYALLLPNSRTGKAGGHFIQEPELPSPYLLHVFVLSEQQLSTAFSSHWERGRVPEEILFQGHTGVGVTSGIYLSDEELKDKDFLVHLLLQGLSLEPQFPPNPDTFQMPGNPNSPKPDGYVPPTPIATSPPSQSGCPVADRVCDRISAIERALFVDHDYEWFVQNHEPPGFIMCNEPTGYFGKAPDELCEGAGPSEARHVYSISPDRRMMFADGYKEVLREWFEASVARTADSYGPAQPRLYSLACPTTPGRPDCDHDFIIIFSKIETGGERSFLHLSISPGNPPTVPSTVSTYLGPVIDPALLDPIFNGGSVQGITGPPGRTTNYYVWE